MKRKNLPAWQQVLLVALESVPGAKNGRDAWDKLNDGEQAAVMGFLTERCGEEAQAKLEETCGKVKPSKRGAWLWALLVIVIAIAVAIWVFHMLEERFGDLHDYVIILLCLSRLEQAWNVTTASRMAQVWSEHLSNRDGAASALKEMERLLSLPPKELRSKAALIFYSALLALVIFLTFVIP